MKPLARTLPVAWAKGKRTLKSLVPAPTYFIQERVCVSVLATFGYY